MPERLAREIGSSRMYETQEAIIIGALTIPPRTQVAFIRQREMQGITYNEWQVKSPDNGYLGIHFLTEVDSEDDRKII